MSAYKQSSFTKEHSYRTSLRSSSSFLNMLMLRGSLSSTYYSPRLKTNEDCGQFKRFSNLNSIRVSMKNQKVPQEQVSYRKLKDTLETLQEKINKAQKILGSPKRSKKIVHNIESDVEITISDMDEKTTKKNEQNSKFMIMQEKISEISKNSSIKTCKINKSSQQSDQGIKYSKQYYISSLLLMNNQKTDSRVKKHVKLSFDVFKKLRNFEAPEHKQFGDYKVILPPVKGDRKTLLLDIDDTILNCDDVRDPEVKYDFELEIQDEDGIHFQVFIKLRPYTLTFLKNISKIYEVIAFSGSIQNYTRKVIEQIDPDHQIFSHMLYRSNCFQFCSGIYVKDVRIVNRRAENIILVDNSPYAYINQLQNGVPILPYEKGSDQQLPKLQKYLIALSKCPDVRQMNKKIFKFHRYNQFESINELVNNLYSKYNL